jgi:hypothetical protein
MLMVLGEDKSSTSVIYICLTVESVYAPFSASREIRVIVVVSAAIVPENDSSKDRTIIVWSTGEAELGVTDVMATTSSAQVTVS